jgi:hypothetical protein
MGAPAWMSRLPRLEWNCLAGSSNGRTPGSGPGSLGSNPSPAASQKAPLKRGFFVGCLADGRWGYQIRMTVISKRNAVVGWAAIKLAKRFARRKAHRLTGGFR